MYNISGVLKIEKTITTETDHDTNHTIDSTPQLMPIVTIL